MSDEKKNHDNDEPIMNHDPDLSPERVSDGDAPQPKTPRNVTMSKRTYFILDTDGNTVLDNQNSGKDCEKWIIVNGNYDMPYTIGYRVVSLMPITKQSKVTLKR